MTISIDQDISVEGPNTALIHGSVTAAAANVTGVEIFDSSGNDLGPAMLGNNGTWSFDAFFDPQLEIDAVATDSAGGKQKSEGFGIEANSPLTSQIASFKFESDSETFTAFGMNGRSLYNGTIKVANQNQSADVVGLGGASIAYTDFLVTREVIENFRSLGPQRDTLNLSDTSLQSLADVLHHTTMSNGSATIHLDSQASVTLDGVTRQQIAMHPHEFVFTGGHT